MTGDVATILRLIAQSSELTPADYIKKTVGNVLFVYYQYQKYFHTKPFDLTDLVDGLLFISAEQYVEKLQWEEEKARLERERSKR